MHHPPLRWTLWACSLLPLAAWGSSTPAWRALGDARLTWQADAAASNAGAKTVAEALSLRARIGAETTLADGWRLRLRLAGRFSTDQQQTRFWPHPWTPGHTGLQDGDLAMDELFLRFLPADDKGSVRIGRFQTRFALNDLMSKSLDHRDSSGAAVTWTHGVHWRHHLSDTWRWHTLARLNAAAQASAVTRAPLVFDHPGSRVTWFAGLQGLHRQGPVTETMVGITWMPRSLAPDGLAQPARVDYLTLTARAMSSFPLGSAGEQVRLGAELGYAPHTPTRVALGLGTQSRAGAWAGQLSAGLYGLLADHDVSLVYGRAQDGWLISPNFRPNEDLLELRYRWRLSPRMSVSVRMRQRQQRLAPPGATQAREDAGWFLRLDLRL